MMRQYNNILAGRQYNFSPQSFAFLGRIFCVSFFKIPNPKKRECIFNREDRFVLWRFFRVFRARDGPPLAAWTLDSREGARPPRKKLRRY
jgi:hypothetical protein